MPLFSRLNVFAVSVVALALPATANAQARRDKIFVPPIRAQQFDEGTRGALMDLVIVAANRADRFDVVTMDDVEEQLAQEKRRDALACSTVSCATEISGALGVRYLLSSRAQKLGSDVLVTVSLIDTQEQRSITGQGRSGGKPENLPEAVNAAIAEALRLLRTEQAPPKSASGTEQQQPQTTPAITGSVDVVFETSHGSFTVRVFGDKAPLSASNFLRYVDDGFYDGTIFHRVINGFMIQGGGFTPDIRQKSTRAAIRNEADNGLKNLRGTVAAARTIDVNSATAQFFINVVDNPRLDFTSPDPRGYGYAVFGEVVAGMDTVDRIKAVPTCPSTDPRCSSVPLPPGYRDVPAEPVVIRRAHRK